MEFETDNAKYANYYFIYCIKNKISSTSVQHRAGVRDEMKCDEAPRFKICE